MYKAFNENIGHLEPDTGNLGQGQPSIRIGETLHLPMCADSNKDSNSPPPKKIKSIYIK